ncbi:MAG TPA: hypothetical protein VK403_02045, partial [Allosphingosinicella sp.]|nr:hypothetical protein [Allosphingosinicella sp.]
TWIVTRHSGEGRNPSTLTSTNVRLRPCSWMPAFAGMTTMPEFQNTCTLQRLAPHASPQAAADIPRVYWTLTPFRHSLAT